MAYTMFRLFEKIFGANITQNNFKNWKWLLDVIDLDEI